MTDLDIAVLNFKTTVTKKALVIGVSKNRVFDFMIEDRNKKKKALEKSWTLGSKILRR